MLNTPQKIVVTQNERQCNVPDMCPNGLGLCQNCGDGGACCSPDYDIADVNAGCGVDAVGSISPIISYPVCVRPKDSFYYEPLFGQVLTSDEAMNAEGSGRL